jgi:hypothetical protein
MATAAAAVGGASGVRAWLGARRIAWITPARLKLLTIGLFIGVLVVSGTVSPTGP